MSLHRFRMKSPYQWVVHAGFGSLMVVYVGSYYFCVKKRDHQEKMVNLMMKMNQFDRAADMPDEIPVNDEHPFVRPVVGGAEEDALVERQYVAELPERREWQKQIPQQDAAEVFRDKKK